MLLQCSNWLRHRHLVDWLSILWVMFFSFFSSVMSDWSVSNFFNWQLKYFFFDGCVNTCYSLQGLGKRPRKMVKSGIYIGTWWVGRWMVHETIFKLWISCEIKELAKQSWCVRLSILKYIYYVDGTSSSLLPKSWLRECIYSKMLMHVCACWIAFLCFDVTFSCAD